MEPISENNTSTAIVLHSSSSAPLVSSCAKAREESTREYHEAVKRGRHPRSFPHRKGIWDFVNKSSSRLNRVYSGQKLSSILNVDISEAASFSIESRDIASQQENSPQSPHRGKGVDSIGLAKTYVANYENSSLRSDRASRRLSEFRAALQSQGQYCTQTSAARRRAVQASKTQSGKLNPLLRGNSQVLNLSNLAKSRSAADIGSNSGFSSKSNKKHRHAKKAQKKKEETEVLHNFLNNARKEGHHRRNDTALKYIEKKAGALEEEPIVEDTQCKMRSFDDLRDKTVAESTFDIIEFAPPNMSGKLFFGSQIALQYHDGTFLTVSEPRGAISLMKHSQATSSNSYQTRTLDGEEENQDALDDNPTVVVDKCHTVLFTLVKLDDPEYVGPITAGDNIWLCIRPGNGQITWTEGSILGSRATQGAYVKTIAIDKRQEYAAMASTRKKVKGPVDPDSVSRAAATDAANDATHGAEATGIILPILTYIPRLPGQSKHEKSLDDLYRDATNIQRIQRINRSASHLGRWKIQAASNQGMKAFREARKISSAMDGGTSESSGKASMLDNMPITNGMAIYLEQDWVYLAIQDNETDPHLNQGHVKDQNGNVVLKSMPKVSSRGKYCVDRAGVWHVRLVQTKHDAGGTAQRFKSAEQVLYRARVQLKSSEASRNGTKTYIPGLSSGTMFSKQIRNLRQNLENQCDTMYLGPVESMEPMIKEYFFDRFSSVNVGSGSGKKNKDAQSKLNQQVGGFPKTRMLSFSEDDRKEQIGDGSLSLGPASEVQGGATNKGTANKVSGGATTNTKSKRYDDQAALEREAIFRATAAYQARNLEQGLTPWYDTVFHMKVTDKKLLSDTFKDPNDKKAKPSTLALLTGQKDSGDRKIQREIEKEMSKPIYQTLLTEDVRIKSYISSKLGPKQKNN